MAISPRFREILSEGIRRAAARQRRKIGDFEQDLAEAIGYEQASIHRWRRGHIPGDKPLEAIARYLIQTGELGRNWLDRFLSAADYQPKAYLLNKLLHVQETSVSAPNQTDQRIDYRDTSLHEDWGEAPDISIFYGRQEELTELEKWIVDDHCRLVALLGMGGIGKTALAAKLAQQIKDQFDYIIWRSLLNAPPFEDILGQCIQFLSDQQEFDLPESIDKRISRLIDYLRQHRCLLVLDNVEAILREGDRAGHYREGYEAYGQLIRRIGETEHQSCLVLTSREKPKEFAPLEGETSPVRSLQLRGLGHTEGREVLKDKGLFGVDETWIDLIGRYSGNPLALKVASETIREVFDGDIAHFLNEEAPIFGGIRDLLSQQFARLSELEQEIMLWLAIEREAISPEDLHVNIVRPVSNRNC